MPTIRFEAASRANYTVAHRPSSAIRMVVVHVTESSALGAISWFRNPRAAASANYVVSGSGAITQMVPDSDIAWHAGNWAINRESIGVEHEGYTYRPGSFTDAEYRASARLVGYELRRYLLPIDRKHVIGHNEVPDPNHPGLRGGFAHHTDPGPNWNWGLYMRYVATYAHGSNPAPHFEAPPAAKAAAAKPQITAKVTGGKVSVSSSGLDNGQTVAGYVRWRANVGNAEVARVDFLVDGRVRWTEKQKPFEFGGNESGWDTTRETNGVHVLTLRVVTKKGATAGQSLRVVVENSPFEIASADISNGQTLKGKLRWEAVPSGAQADHVDFLLDGKVVHTENEAPFVYGDSSPIDTSTLPNGPHTLSLRAVAADGRVAESSITIVVANVTAPVPTPKPKPAGASTSIVLKGVGSGQQVSGKVPVEGSVTGARPDRVEFLVDGRWRWTERSAPYEMTWDTTEEQAGTHVLTVRALARNGLLLDTQTITVSVQSRLSETSAPAPTTMTVVSSLADGTSVHGSVSWTGTVSGSTPDHIDFLVDGSVRRSDRSSPYEATWDTTKETNGAHALVLRAVAKDGTTAQVGASIVVANAAPTPDPAVDIASQTLADGQVVSGTPTWTVKTSGATPDRVEYWIDGKLRHTENSAPYEFAWDTTKETEGAHQLVAKAVKGTQSVQRSLTVTVKNAAAAATPPATTAPLAIESQTLHDGQTVSGAVSWQVVTSGPNPDRVEFWVDGTLRSTEKQAPYVFNGDGATWDTTKETDGKHELLVKAITGAGRVKATITVTVANAVTPSPPASTAVAIASQTLVDGSTISGTVNWQATVTGSVRRVELQIDGTRVATLRSSPYGGSLDTRQLRNGSHTFTVRVVGTDGSDATASVKVTVANT